MVQTFMVSFTGHKDGALVREQTRLTPNYPCPQEKLKDEMTKSIAHAFPELTAISLVQVVVAVQHR